MIFPKLEPVRPARPAGPPVPGAVPVGVGEGPRDYLFIGVAAVLVVGLVLVARSGGNPFVLIAVVPALGALLVRATILPAVFLALLVYLAIYPDGLPVGVPPAAIVSQAHFRIVDLVFVAAVGVYFVAYFRLTSLKYRILATTASLPAVAGSPQSSAVPVARQGAAVAGDEYARAFAQVLGLTFAAAFAWQITNVVSVEPLRVPPFRLEVTGNDGTSRFLVAAGALAFGSLAAGSLVWYWSASKMRPAVARQFLLDLGWGESRRELNRREKWRAWGRGQLAREPFRFPARTILRILAFCAMMLLAMAVGSVLLLQVVERF